jgi:hypothetical protein
MKKATLATIALLFLGTGCVMTPTGDIYDEPVILDDGFVDTAVDVQFAPRVHFGSRSAVSVWLHPNFYVYDAYPIAQRHCARWGLFARPRRDWALSARSARYLDYTCVSRRPTLAFPHFRRPGHRSPWIRSRPNNRRVYTPKPVPRHNPIPARRRGTFGRTVQPNPAPPSRSTVVERGKAWEHNANKKPIRSWRGRRPAPKPRTVVERGKAWEHNANKVKIGRGRALKPNPRKGRTGVERGKPWEHNADKNDYNPKSVDRDYELPKKRPPQKRPGFGRSNLGSVNKRDTKTTFSTPSPRFSKSGGLKSKSKPEKRSTLRL